MTDPASPPQPQQLGRYRLLRPLGEGSMGRVFLAQEDSPPRQVALKLLRQSAAFAQRFRREIELLGRLEHPGIARLYAGGVMESGGESVPFLAMEYVPGADLRSYAAAQNLDLSARLALLAAVARGVHYAHTRGIVHRDLKPGNILVAADGQPKILDFGVAHVMENEDQTQMTVAGQVLGTLPYMAPEQLGGTGLVEPRSDVYALGCIGYELLSGQLPHPGLSTASLMSAAEILRTQTPQRLSRLLPAAAGDAETIIAKAMAFEPAQRYDSAAEFAADIERYLARQPIAARPPTVSYVVGLFVRRHRALAAGAALALGAIVAASVVSLRYAIAEAEARREAEARSAEATAVNQFLRDMLTAADPYHTRGPQLTVRELLDGAHRNLLQDRQLPANVGGSLRLTLAETYMNLGLFEPALELNREAAQLPGASPDTVLRARISHAMVHLFSGRAAEAEKELTPLLALLPPAQGEAQNLRIATRNGYAVVLLEQGRLAEGETFLRELLAEADATLGREQDESFETAQNLAAVMQVLGKMDEALKLQEDLVARAQTLYPTDHPSSLHARARLSMMYRDRAEPRAESTVLAVLKDRQRVFGPDHPDSLQSQATLVSVMLLAGRFEEAETQARDLLARNLKQRKPDHMDSLLTKNQLGEALLGRGQYAPAAQLFRDVQASGAAAEHALVLSDGLGLSLLAQGRLAEAAQEFERLLALTRKKLPADHPKLARFASSAAACALRRGDAKTALALLEPAYATLLAKSGAAHPNTQLASQRLEAARKGTP